MFIIITIAVLYSLFRRRTSFKILYCVEKRNISTESKFLNLVISEFPVDFWINNPNSVELDPASQVFVSHIW